MTTTLAILICHWCRWNEPTAYLTHFFISFIEQFADLLIPISVSTAITLMGIFAKSSFIFIMAYCLTMFSGHWSCIQKGRKEHWKYVYRYSIVEPRDFAIKLPSYLKQIICFLPSSSLTAGLPSAIRTLKVWTMSNRKRLFMVLRIKYILDVVIVQNSRALSCCNWCEERKFYVVRNYLILIAWKSIFHAKLKIRILKPYL